MLTDSAPTAQRQPLMSSLTGDERLASLVGTGDERAFTQIYERYQAQLYRYCLAMTRHEADAQDALQATFTAAYVALYADKRNAPLRPWLFRIAHNEAVTALRRRRSHTELTDSIGLSAPAADVEAAERARLQTLVSDLQALPERQRAALVMRELSGLSHDEIAVALGTSQAAAKQTIYEARTSLLHYAQGREVSCEEIRIAVSDGDGRVARGRRVRAHLSVCEECAAFAAAMQERRVALRALTPPLPGVAATALLARVLRGGATHAGAGAGAAGGAAGSAGGAGAAAGGGISAGAGGTAIATGAVGKAAVVSVAVKALSVAAVAAVTGVGVHAVLHHPAPSHHAAEPVAARAQTVSTPAPSRGAKPVTVALTRQVRASSGGVSKPPARVTTARAKPGQVHAAHPRPPHLKAPAVKPAHPTPPAAKPTHPTAAAVKPAGSKPPAVKPTHLAHPAHPVHPAHPAHPAAGHKATAIRAVLPLAAAGVSKVEPHGPTPPKGPPGKTK